ncbi:hypothetical protein EMMF5_006586, partial [Cystobasidiomycetes sp. EMM_F5]
MATVNTLGLLATFRGVNSPDGFVSEIIDFQESAAFASGLRSAGVRSVVVGEVLHESSFYSIVHEVSVPEAISDNLCRYYPAAAAKALASSYGDACQTAQDAGQCKQLLGR